jgi:hypothetical protein
MTERSSPDSVQDAMQECVDIAMQYDDCGGEFIAQKIRDRILSLQPATPSPIAQSSECSCDWATGECQGPVGCKAVAQAIAQSSEGESAVAATPQVSLKRMGLSDGRTDYFVMIKVGDREVSPHVFRDEYKAAYHVALYDWLLTGRGEKPEIVAFGPHDWPARPVDPAQPSGMREALQECIDVLALVEHPRREDPQYGVEVAALGDRIGYGALMSSASASWRKRLKEDGYPVGGEFVAGPCQATVTRALRMAREALTISSTEGK